jgi:short subunit dehydrogenase-like uncharacterized protein
MLMPGVGFDVVPSDCLAAHLKRRLPTATYLALAISALTRISHGTAATMIENLHRGGLVRRAGRLGGRLAVEELRHFREMAQRKPLVGLRNWKCSSRGGRTRRSSITCKN